MKPLCVLTRCVVREIARSPYFWLLGVVGSLFFQSHYFLCVQYEGMFVNSSPALGINNTIFYFGNLPSFFLLLLQLSVIVVALNAFGKIDQRPELVSRPHRNSSILLAHALGSSFSILVLVFVNVTAIFASALLGALIDINYGNVPTLAPAVTLLLFDLPATLLFWSFLALLMNLVARNAIVAGVLSSIASLSIWAFALSMPQNWIGVLSSYSYSVMVVSDLIHRLPDVEILLSRGATLLSAFALCALAAFIWRRQEVKRRRDLRIGCFALGAALLAFGTQIYAIQSSVNMRQNWTQAHADFNANKTADLTSLTGDMVVQTGKRLDLDIDLALSLDESFDASVLVFSFNPGMNITRLSVDDVERDFNFESGVLSIPYRCDPCAGARPVVSVRAHGKPDVRFGYLESEIEYLHSPGISPHVRKFLGTHNALFSKQFVALMPGIRWHPIPGLLSVDKHVDALVHAPDLYDVNLNVSIERENWHVAGPGIRTRDSRRTSSFNFRTERAVPPFAILSSKFVSRRTSVDNVTIELLMHERHDQSIQPLTVLEDKFKEQFANQLEKLRRLNLQFSNSNITFVEVPNHLRTVSGYGMHFVYSLPGIVLLRESSFPNNNVDDIKNELKSNLDGDAELAEHLYSYFEEYDQENILGGGIREALANQLHPYAYRQFTNDNVALNYLARMAISESFQEYHPYFDAGLIAGFATIMTGNPVTTIDRFLRSYITYHPLTLDTAMIVHLYEGQAMLDSKLKALPALDVLNESISSRRILRLKIAAVVRLLRSIYDEEALHQILSQMLQPVDADQCDESVECIYQAASSLGWNLSPVVREWMTTDALPSYQVSRLRLYQVSDAESTLGHQASFDIRNDSDVHGVMLLTVSHELGSDVVQPGKTFLPQKSYQVNLYSDNPIEEVMVWTFHAASTRVYPLLPAIRSDEVQQRVRPMVEHSDWLPDDEYVIVDNLDPEVQLLSHSSEDGSIARAARAWFDLEPDLPRVLRNGIETNTFRRPFSSHNWTHSENWTSYGKHSRTNWTTYGESAPAVRFTATLPHTGEWNLDYHFPYRYPYLDQYGRYNFVLRHGSNELPISIDANGLDGWILLGKFDIDSSVVHLDLESVEPSNSIRVADAIRWKRADESR